MFSKAVALLVLAACAIAGPIPEGTYRITNVASRTTARVDYAGGPIYVSIDNKDPGPFQVWDIKNVQDDGYTIDNVGLNTIQMLDSLAAVRVPQSGEPVVTNRDPTVFNFEPAGAGAFVIKLQNDDLLWNVEPPVVPKGGINLRPADGGETERWTFTAVQWPPA